MQYSKPAAKLHSKNTFNSCHLDYVLHFKKKAHTQTNFVQADYETEISNKLCEK